MCFAGAPTPTLPPGVAPIVTQGRHTSQASALGELTRSEAVRTAIGAKTGVVVSCAAVSLGTPIPGWACGALVGGALASSQDKFRDPVTGPLAIASAVASAAAGAFCSIFGGPVGGGACSWLVSVVTDGELVRFLAENPQVLQSIPITGQLGNAIGWAGCGSCW
jgi:hypothetical protein